MSMSDRDRPMFRIVRGADGLDHAEPLEELSLAECARRDGFEDHWFIDFACMCIVLMLAFAERLGVKERL